MNKELGEGQGRESDRNEGRSIKGEGEEGIVGQENLGPWESDSFEPRRPINDISGGVQKSARIQEDAFPWFGKEESKEETCTKSM